MELSRSFSAQDQTNVLTAASTSSSRVSRTASGTYYMSIVSEWLVKVSTSKNWSRFRSTRRHCISITSASINLLPIKTQTLFHAHMHRSRLEEKLRERPSCFCSRNTLSGGAKFFELKAQCDVVTNDEVSMLLEPESLIPMFATVKQSALGRLHYIEVGDFNQLSGYSNTSAIVRHGETGLNFN